MLAFLLRAFCRLSAALPLRAALAFGRGAGALFGLIPRGRRRADENLAACFPDKSDSERRAIRRAMFRHLGVNAIETLRWAGGKGDELAARVDAVNMDAALRVAAEGRGMLALVAHLGNWDMTALWAARTLPLTIISKDIKNKSLNAFWMEKRAASGLKIVPAHNSYRKCLSVLKKGEWLGFILDQNMIRREGIFVNFFGRPACTTPGLAVLSAHARAPVVPVFVVRQSDGRHRAEFMDVIPPPPDRSPESIAAATQQYTRIVEDAIRRTPEQWIWMHRRWRTQPAVEQKAPPSGPIATGMELSK